MQAVAVGSFSVKKFKSVKFKKFRQTKNLSWRKNRRSCWMRSSHRGPAVRILVGLPAALLQGSAWAPELSYMRQTMLSMVSLDLQSSVRSPSSQLDLQSSAERSTFAARLAPGLGIKIQRGSKRTVASDGHHSFHSQPISLYKSLTS